MSTLSGKSSELSALIRVRDEINKEDQARWLAVVELSLFLTRAWADFLFPDKKLPHARELMLGGGVIFIWDLKGKPLTETGVARVIGMPHVPPKCHDLTDVLRSWKTLGHRRAYQSC